MLTAGLAGCGGGGTGPNLPDPIIRFVNCSPDSNPLDFYINTDNEAPALTYLNSSADITTKKADHDLSVNDSVTTDELDAIAFTFAQDDKYLALTVGLENFGSEFQKRLQLLAFQYDKNPPNGTKARLLIIHGYVRSPGFDTPNIDFQGGDVGSYDSNNPQFAATDITFASPTPSILEVDSGVPLIFQARRAGTENVLAEDPSTTFDSGGIYLALVTGVEGQTGTEVPQVKYIKLN
ncbi:MAG TPA: DUF4397 domain-containing protein [Fimbriimonadaceae bacterium]|nr:DUF4397 domain-containing protein [Fimbriimonadaceae bacterium]